MIRKSIVDNLEIKITIPAGLLLLVICVVFAMPSLANEGCVADEISATELSPDEFYDVDIQKEMGTNNDLQENECKLLPDLNDGYDAEGIKLARNDGDDFGADETEFTFTKTVMPEYETESIKASDILRTIPSITTQDNKTLGLIIPPFAYFAKKF